ncbi:MAG: hypothetical protein QXF25_00015 [Candidatus Pacearchaeota archaeon]
MKLANIKFMNLILAIILGLSLVSAFGVSSPYWEGNPLKIARGETRTIELTLQNIANAVEDIKAELKVVEGAEIASLEKESYIIKANSAEKAILSINVPSNAQPGKVYKVKIETKTITPGITGAVSMGTGIKTSFDVIVEEREKEKSNFWIYIVLGVIVLVMIIYLTARKRKEE